VTGITVERKYPLVLGIVAAVVIFVFYRRGYTNHDMAQILGTVLTVGSIGAGFVATAKSILLTLSGRTVRRLKVAGYYSILVEYMIHATRWCLILSAVSLAGCFIDMKAQSLYCDGFFAIYGGLTALTGASVYRTFHTFSELIRAAAKEQ
jgi:hypothetical protein